jgi:hypothetical protein
MAQDMPTVTPDPAPNWTITDVLDDITYSNIHPQFCPHIPDVRVQYHDELIQNQTPAANESLPQFNDDSIHQLPTPGEIGIPTLRMMQSVAFQANHPTKPFQLHIDGGSNRSVTDDKSLLIHYRKIRKTTMNGASQEGPILTCIGEGYLPWRANNGTYIFVKCLYSPDVAETILSPTDICLTCTTDFNAWCE